MNICIIAPRYPYKDNMEFVFVKKLVDEWAKAGHHCVVLTTFSWTTYIRGRIDYKPCHYTYKLEQGLKVDVYNVRTITTKIKKNGVSFDFWMECCALERKIKQLGIYFDFIYCHFFSSALLGFRYAKNNNIPFFVATGESKIDSLPKPYPKFTWEQFRSYTNGVIAVSTKNRDEAVGKGYINNTICKVFPNGTDTNLFKPFDKDNCRAKLGFPRDAFIISCVGYICERKGQNRVLEAVRKIEASNIKLLFLGKTAQIDSFSLEGEEILFKGPVKNKELPIYLGTSDLFCLPTRAEGCCNAVIEALACGLPIVSSNLPFNWDILDEGNSIMVNPNDVDEIAVAIKTLYNDDNKRKALSCGALRTSLTLSIKRRAEDVLDFIKTRI